MARDAELKAHLTAQDDASKVIDKAAKAAEEFEKPHETKLDADVAGALAALDQVAAEAKATAEAAEALGRALGPELAAKADPAAIVGDLKQMGLSLDQIKGNADELGAKMRELSDTDVGGKLGSSLGTARGKLDEVAKSADSSKSVLANMVGNATQDLGALGGVAGSAGVAIGQMGEYMVDAKGAGDSLGDVLRNFSKVAVPIAAITVVMSSIGSIFKAAGDRAARAAQQVQSFTGALSDIGDAKGAVSGLATQMQKFDADARTAWGGFVEGVAGAVKAIPLLGGLVGDAGQNITNIIPTFNKLGISADDIAAAAVKGGSAWDQLQVSLWGAQEAGQITSDEYAAASQILKEFRGSAEDATNVNKFLGKSTEEIAAAAAEAAEQQAGLTRSTMLAEQAARDLGAQWDALSGQLDAEQAIANIGSDFDDMRAKGAAAWAATAAGAEDAQQKQEDYSQSVLTSKQHVVDLGKQIGLSVPEVKSMLLRIDSGDIDRVEQELRILSRNRTMELSVIAKGGQGFGTNIGQNVPGPRAVPPVPAAAGGLAVTATGAPATTGTGAAAPIVVPVVFQLPTATQVARRIGPVRIPLFVTANLLADRRVNGNL